MNLDSGKTTIGTQLEVAGTGEVARHLSHVICPGVPDESVNTIARLRRELRTANFVSDWILERVRARGWFRGHDTKRDRREKKKGSGKRRCVPPRYLSFLRRALTRLGIGTEEEDTRSWYAVISAHYHARVQRAGRATCIH